MELQDVEQWEIFGLPVRGYRSPDGKTFSVMAVDVAQGLGYETAKDFTRRCPERMLSRKMVQTRTGIRDVIFLSETGLYYCVLRSDKDEVREFQAWLLDDVLVGAGNPKLWERVR